VNSQPLMERRESPTEAHPNRCRMKRARLQKDLLSFAGLLNSSSPSNKAYMNQQEPAPCSISVLYGSIQLLLFLLDAPLEI
jgi:hypothetical protein